MNSDYGSISFNLFLWLFEKSTEESWINSTILFVNFIKIEHICETFLTRIEKERKKLAENAESRIRFSKSSVHFSGSIIKFINWTFRSPKNLRNPRSWPSDLSFTFNAIYSLFHPIYLHFITLRYRRNEPNNRPTSTS